MDPLKETPSNSQSPEWRPYVIFSHSLLSLPELDCRFMETLEKLDVDESPAFEVGWTGTAAGRCDEVCAIVLAVVAGFGDLERDLRGLGERARGVATLEVDRCFAAGERDRVRSLDDTASKKDRDVGLNRGWLMVDDVLALLRVGEEDCESMSASAIVVMGEGASFGIDTGRQSEEVYIGERW